MLSTDIMQTVEINVSCSRQTLCRLWRSTYHALDRHYAADAEALATLQKNSTLNFGFDSQFEKKLY